MTEPQNKVSNRFADSQETGLEWKYEKEGFSQSAH
jgi:hypothetical protein